MMKFGLEKEYFVLDSNKNPLIIPRALQTDPDESGILAEARGKPYHNITEAVFSLLADEYTLKQKALNLGIYLDDSPIMKVSRKLKLDAARIYAKGMIHYQNIYGFAAHKNSHNEHTAGVHLSVTCPEVLYVEKEKGTYNSVWDFVNFFRYLDNNFSEEIKLAKRRPGFYEIKSDGRVEYRSLPANVDLMKLISVVNKFSW